MDDLIDRQAAIDDAHRQIWYRMNPSMRERIDEWLNALPSVQADEENCDDCVHGYFGNTQCYNCRVGYPSHFKRRRGQDG